MAGSWRSISGTCNQGGAWIISTTIRYMPASYGTVYVQIDNLPHHNLVAVWSKPRRLRRATKGLHRLCKGGARHGRGRMREPHQEVRRQGRA
jgi:hypothetical protein